MLAQPEAALTRKLIAASTSSVTYSAPGAEHGTTVSCRALSRILHRHRRRTIALNGIDLTVTPGESIAIVGRSGSGKTTLIGTLAALDRPHAGTVLHDGHDVWTSPGRERRTVRRGIGLIFQDPLASFDPRYTVRRVIVEAGRVITLSEGRVVEDRRAEALDNAEHPETRRLLDAAGRDTT